MTRLSRAKLTLAILCGLFFLLGTGSATAISLFFPAWLAGPAPVSLDPGIKEMLRLTPEQEARRLQLAREANARLKRLNDEIKRLYYPKIQRVNREYSERLKREILTPEQRRLLEELSTRPSKTRSGK